MTTPSTATLEPHPGAAPAARPRAVRPIPFSRLVVVEARKSFDTRSGFWLLMSIGLAALVASGAVVLWAPDDAQTYSSYATAIGFPMAVILPIIAILSVTGEWSQRNGLTTFTLVPHRGRTVLAKAVVAVGVGIVSMLVAAAVGALGNVVGTALAGVEATWDVSATDLALIILANVLGLLVGFMLGVLVRSSAGAIVGYFVYSLALPPLSMLLAASQDWFHDLQPWVDFNYAQSALFNAMPSGEQWAQLGTAGLVWLVVPLAVGIRLVLRAEVK